MPPLLLAKLGTDFLPRLKTFGFLLVGIGLLAYMDTLLTPFNHHVWLIVIVLAGVYITLVEWPDLATADDDPHMWLLLGALYACVMPSFFAWLIFGQQAGLWLLWCCLLVAVADVAAMLTGRLLGGPKLCPLLSPKKTWSGFLGALAVCNLLAFLPWGPTTPAAKLVAATLLVAVATGGDIVESWLKRRAGKKDSGTLLPGHGGLFDRLDSHITAIPLTALFVWIWG